MTTNEIEPILAEAKSIWETASFQAAVYTALFTTLAGICTGAWAICQRRDELRWKQAKLGRKMLDEIFDFRPSNDAWRMVDDETAYKDLEKIRIQITMTDVRRALQLPLKEAADKEDKRKADYVRWCFDALFYYLERLEQSVRIKVIRLDDLLAPTSYYIEVMAKDKALFQAYAGFIQFNGALAFMDRFLVWKNAAA